MKKVFFLMLLAMVVVVSCKKKKDEIGPSVQTVTVQLVYPAGSSFTAQADVTVKLTAGSSSFTAKTDVSGKAVFTVPVGIYEASATDTRSNGGVAYIFNGVVSNIAVTGNWATNTQYSDGGAAGSVALKLQQSQSSQVVIKEVFVGGTPKDDGSGFFAQDRYVVLYNNSATIANLGNICLATTMTFNSTGTNNYYGTDGNLTYASAGWIPAGQAFWYFQQNVSLEPGKQVVIALNNAVNNTVTYSKSINFDKAEYYCTYDIANFSHAATYPAPAASIPTTHYLKAQKYGTGTAWTLSSTSPGFFIFDTKGTTPTAFGADASANDTYSGSLISKKVPTAWIVDGVESFQLNNTTNKKRLTAAVDAGYVYHDNSFGYSIYRNVDKAATEAVAGNAGKIVYNYSLGTTSITGGTTDPSGIDAEASIKGGARIIYQDKNNSTLDFHLRSKASLRTN